MLAGVVLLIPVFVSVSLSDRSGYLTFMHAWVNNVNPDSHLLSASICTERLVPHR